MHDPLAAALLLRPELVTTTRGAVQVAIGGVERGRTTFGGDGPPIDVALAVDASTARDVLMDALAAVPDP